MRPHLLAFGVMLFAVRGATANPAQSCRDLAPKAFAKLDAKAHERFDSEDWERAKAWPTYVVSVQVNRAPHLVRAILAECPGVTKIDVPQAIDARHFAAEVDIKVTSFAALSRILQLPAVVYVSVRDPSIRIKHPIPEPMMDFE